MGVYSRTERENFKNNLKGLLWLKKSAGISATTISEIIHTTSKKLSSWKNGEYIPNGIELEELCKYFDVDARDLFYNPNLAKDLGYDSVSNIEPAKNKTVSLSDEARQLVDIYNALSVKDRLRLLTFAFELNGETIDTPHTGDRVSFRDKVSFRDRVSFRIPEDEKTEL